MIITSTRDRVKENSANAQSADQKFLLFLREHLERVYVSSAVR